MPFLSGKRFFLLGIVIILLAAIPLTLYLVQKQQETRSQAARSTTLSFAPASSQASPIQKNVGDAFILDVMLDPCGADPTKCNEVIYTNLSITYDPSKLTTDTAGLSANPEAFVSILDGPTYTSGNAVIMMSTGTDITRSIKTKTKIATIAFKTLAATTTPIQIAFGDETTVTSTLADPEINVLSSKTPAFIAIGGDISPTPTLTLTPTLTPTSPPITGGQNQSPVCSALNVDRATSGTAPLSITFTANGNDSDGTVNKVTFDFGDGPIQDVTSGGGIGAKSVSVQVSHTYNNPGTFTAAATLTDNSNATSSPATCTQTITVSQASVTQSPQPTNPPVVTASPAPIVTVAPPGPGDKIIGVGLAGIITTILGALIFFAL